MEHRYVGESDGEEELPRKKFEPDPEYAGTPDCEFANF